MEYITRYCLDLEVETAATEIRIYADENGKFQVPKEYQADVSYGDNIKAAVAFLYSEGVVADDRIVRTARRWREGSELRKGGRCIVISSVI